MSTSTTAVRNRLAIALDTSDLDTAVSIAKAVQPDIGVAKVGLQLFSAAGRDAVRAIQDIGMDVFLDVKLHDIPNTVYGASTVLGALGVQFLTVHAGGGTAMLEAAVKGLSEGASNAGFAAPTVLAVTVLTSAPDASPELLNERLAAAVAANCGGVVCAASDLSVIRATAPEILTVVPGIRPAGGAVHDQQRVATPTEAIRSGASILVLGRAITGADDPAEAAKTIASEVAQAS
ncbi:orotidine-5'-phosphate decarboxylase [Nocardia salmonicida]|uniref:orotidine-5'-phosphate decarboxylase n=1 Tax=Nocardia salmonicida TaxID=53431 RepID=UPI0007A37A71|nr:orotidine-5'-phosphate decarboxylase [Nocardia salmonicida]MBC7299456.1 orotidine-5'-phosphate decarboxylase [Nocardia sp.]